jgi:hypothetical protein
MVAATTVQDTRLNFIYLQSTGFSEIYKGELTDPDNGEVVRVRVSTILSISAVLMMERRLPLNY